jgi:MFS family permease
LSSRWDFDDSHFVNTVTQRFNLVCGPSEYIPRFAQSAFFCGNLVGILICGWAADHFGRKPVILISSMICGVASVLGALAPNITIWIIAR